MPAQASEKTECIGALWLGGDWACAHGDYGALRQIAMDLQDRVPEPMHHQLVELALACLTDPARAGTLWHDVKQYHAAH